MLKGKLDGEKKRSKGGMAKNELDFGMLECDKLK